MLDPNVPPTTTAFIFASIELSRLENVIVVKAGATGADTVIVKTPGSLSSSGFNEPLSKKSLNDDLVTKVGFEYVGAVPKLPTVPHLQM